jgi:predicted AlkP superfamily pyrophosphatase or phosphodiesterase
MRLPILLLVLVAAILPAPVLHAADAASPAHVVVITIDGFPSYLLDDPKAPIATIRMLAKQGAVAQGGMRVSNPAITWPNHTTLVTGVRPAKHSVLFNGVLVRPGNGKPVHIDPARDQADLVAVPTVFELLHKAGLRTAAINWPCTRNSSGLDDNFPDVPEPVVNMTPRLREDLVSAAVLSDPTDPSFKNLSSAARDQIWTAAACRVIRERKPNLLLFHLLVVDGLHHNYGPQTAAAYTGLALADRHVRDILDALDAAGIRKETTLFVMADHGFATATNLLFPNILLRKAGMLTAGPTGIVHAQAMAISEGGSALVYLDNRQAADADRAKLVALFKDQPGIDRIIEPADFPRLGLPVPSDKTPQAPDLVLSPKAGYAFSNMATGEEFIAPIVMGRQNVGYHGYLADNPKMNALFIASGRGIRPASQIESFENINVAPTIAHVFGQEFSNIDGKTLTALFEADFPPAPH